MSAPQTLVEKIWDEHVVSELGHGLSLLHIDRHFLHDLSGTLGLKDLVKHGRAVRSPELSFSVPDHTVSSDPARTEASGLGVRFVRGLREHSKRQGIRLFDFDDDEQGIVHVIGPELGLTLPGTTIVCGDSHTSTHGALGALAWGIGSSEVEHVLATQTLALRRPRTMRVLFEGEMGEHVEAKDLILFLIGKIGADGGAGHAVEYAGSTVRGLSIEARATICNLSIEFGARMGIVAPDDVTFDYVKGRRFAPDSAFQESALASWQEFASDEGAHFDREVEIVVADIKPQISWGTSPEQVIGIGERIPDPADLDDAEARKTAIASLSYMGLVPGTPICDVAIDRVFIGSCANSRLSDLQSAAEVVRGRRVAPHVKGWVVAGSKSVKRAAEAEGLDQVFRSAGFEWREPSCSLCVGANGERVAPGERCVSTSNRNFVGRQGPGSRTHLASPSTAAASAILGSIGSARQLGGSLSWLTR